MDSVTLYDENNITVTVRIDWTDHHSNPGIDGDWATPDDIKAWIRGAWYYVTIAASVTVSGAELTTDYLGGVVHGTLGNGTEVNALEITKRTDSAAGSSAVELATEALSTAQTWADRFGSIRLRDALSAAKASLID